MINEPEIEVMCDDANCGVTEFIRPEYKYYDMSGKHGFYDCSDEAIEAKLKNIGWSCVSGKQFCEDCKST